MFGKQISFNTVFNPEATSIYGDPPEEKYKPKSIRIVRTEKLDQELTGIIVGQTWKCDGKYYEGYYGDDEYDPPYLIITKKWPFWIVYTEMNQQYLVPKKPMPEDRLALNV